MEFERKQTRFNASLSLSLYVPSSWVQITSTAEKIAFSTPQSLFPAKSFLASQLPIPVVPVVSRIKEEKTWIHLNLFLNFQDVFRFGGPPTPKHLLHKMSNFTFGLVSAHFPKQLSPHLAHLARARLSLFALQLSNFHFREIRAFSAIIVRVRSALRRCTE